MLKGDKYYSELLLKPGKAWLNGEELNYTNLVPNPGKSYKPGSCAFVDDEFGGKWDFWDCNDPTSSICQARKSNNLNLNTIT